MDCWPGCCAQVDAVNLHVFVYVCLVQHCWSHKSALVFTIGPDDVVAGSSSEQANSSGEAGTAAHAAMQAVNSSGERRDYAISIPRH